MRQKRVQVQNNNNNDNNNNNNNNNETKRENPSLWPGILRNLRQQYEKSSSVSLFFFN